MWNQISTPNFAYQNDQRKMDTTFGDFENKTLTHTGVTHAISKIFQEFFKSISQGIESKFWYPQNQHDSLNQFYVFEMENSST